MNDHDVIELDDVEGMVTKDGRSINDGPFKIKPRTKRTRKRTEKRANG